MNRYREPVPISWEDAMRAIASGDGPRIANALVSLALHFPDRQRLEDLFVDLLKSPDPEVRGCAATCLGHVARIHRAIDAQRVVPALVRLAKDPEVGGRAEDALEDISRFSGV
jgi:uncharacterized protein (DUF2336 family)